MMCFFRKMMEQDVARYSVMKDGVNFFQKNEFSSGGKGFIPVRPYRRKIAPDTEPT